MPRRLALVLLALGTPAAAQVVFSPEATVACMQQTPGQGASCAGASAEQCMMDTSAGESTVGMGGCLEAEWLWWDGRLNDAFRGKLTEAKAADAEAKAGGWTAPAQEEALRAMQRAWIAFRDARCEWAASLYGGGTGQGPATLGCLMTTTAEQAEYLAHSVP